MASNSSSTSSTIGVIMVECLPIIHTMEQPRQPGTQVSCLWSIHIFWEGFWTRLHSRHVPDCISLESSCLKTCFNWWVLLPNGKQTDSNFPNRLQGPNTIQSIYQCCCEPIQVKCSDLCLGTGEWTSMQWMFSIGHYKLGYHNQCIYQGPWFHSHGYSWWWRIYERRRR